MTYQTMIVCFPFAMVALSAIVAYLRAPQNDDRNPSCMDNLKTQLSKLPPARVTFFRLDGLWWRRKAVTHEGAEMTFKVEEPADVRR
jgi:hypothetical protein